MDDKVTKESLEPNKFKPSLIKTITLGITSSLILACSPTPGYTMQKGDIQARKQEYAQEFLKSYPAEHSSFIDSSGHDGYSGSGYYSPVRGEPGSSTLVAARVRVGFGSGSFAQNQNQNQDNHVHVDVHANPNHRVPTRGGAKKGGG